MDHHWIGCHHPSQIPLLSTKSDWAVFLQSTVFPSELAKNSPHHVNKWLFRLPNLRLWHPLVAVDRRTLTALRSRLLPLSWAFHVAVAVKNPPANAGGIRDVGSIPELGRSPWRRAWQSTRVFLPGESPWTEEPGRLWSIVLQQVGCDWNELARMHTSQLFSSKTSPSSQGGSGWGIHVNPWLIHVNVWQKPLQYCKVLSLQLIKINGKKKKKRHHLPVVAIQMQHQR